jgi:2-polyprenyl-3-methyl-5-hydroxy-6-metoxy-1,4-benzoquinol methylase
MERSVSGLHVNLVSKLPMSLSRQGKILDLGCGTGAWLERLADNGFENLHGVDADTEQNVGIRATVTQANLDTAGWEKKLGSYDLVTAIEVLEHLENPGQFLTQVAHLLNDNGQLLLTTPNVHSVICRLRYLVLGKLKQFDDKGDPTHIYPVFAENLEKLLLRRGLEIKKLWGYPENGDSLTSRPITNLAGRLLGAILPQRVGGDVLCALIGKRGT